MKQNTVELTLSQLIEDLNNGLTWSKKEDAGYGSIQEKYNVNDINIKTIQKHPKLIGIEPSITIFKVIDDLKDGATSTKPANGGTNELKLPTTKSSTPTPSTEQPASKGSVSTTQNPVVPVEREEIDLGDSFSKSNESVDAFDGL